jgi:glycosyltransferase involved in cell wall biosynthesis
MRLSVLSIAYPLAPVGPDAAGGSEQILTLLDRTLVRGGHRSVVIASEGSQTEGTLIATPSPWGELNDGARAEAQERHRRAIGRALDRWSFDLIHMHSLDFHAYLPPPGPPVLVTLHLPPDWYPPQVFQPSRPGTWLHCVSASQERNCPPSRALLPHVDNGVPLEEYRTTVRKRGFALALGRICPEKGFHLALDAAMEADVPLIVAGEIFRYRAHEEYFWKEMLSRLDGRCRRFIGPVGLARKRRLLAAARCLLVPSLVPETSSLVSMEAMACGTPVIAFPSGALPEIVEHGRTGFIVENAREMAQAMRRVGSIDPEACREAARRRFSAARMIGEYLELYGRLAQTGSRRMLEARGYPVV